MKRIVVVVVLVVFAAVGGLSWRAFQLKPRVPLMVAADSAVVAIPIGIDRFAASLRFATVSQQDSAKWDGAPFQAFREWLVTAYPRVHTSLSRDVVNEHALLYTWKGSNPTLPPLLLTGHYDVVPVEPGTESLWSHPPFSGDTAGGFVWGRGALDDKVSVIGLLEAVDALLQMGFTPTRTVLLAFGHDEEVGGVRGAKSLAKVITERYGTVSMLIDEGGVVGDSLLPGIARRAAVVGVAEKASMSIELSVTAEGGHSSMPPDHTALGRLSKALVALEDQQMQARFTPVTRAMFQTLAPELGFTARLAFANLELFEPLVLRNLTAQPRTASLVRTSTAVTMASGSPKENVLPIRATAVVNFRMLQGDSAESVLAHVTRVVNDTSVSIRVLGTPLKPSVASPLSTPAFDHLTRTIAQWYPGALVVPNLLAGATDTRHYSHLTTNVYRFAPIAISPPLVSSVHGTNERAPAVEFVRGVRFWTQLIRNAQ